MSLLKISHYHGHHIGMVNLITELEQVFEVSFDILEMAEMHNLEIIKTILSEKGVAFNDIANL